MEIIKGVDSKLVRDYLQDYSSGNRSYDTLMKFLKDLFSEEARVEAMLEKTEFEKCTRKGRALKVFRIEWQRKRKAALASGHLKPTDGDVDQLLKAAEMGKQFDREVRTEIIKAQKLHKEKQTSGDEKARQGSERRLGAAAHVCLCVAP